MMQYNTIAELQNYIVLDNYVKKFNSMRTTSRLSDGSRFGT